MDTKKEKEEESRRRRAFGLDYQITLSEEQCAEAARYAPGEFVDEVFGEFSTILWCCEDGDRPEIMVVSKTYDCPSIDIDLERALEVENLSEYDSAIAMREMLGRVTAKLDKQIEEWPE